MLDSARSNRSPLPVRPYQVRNATWIAAETSLAGLQHSQRGPLALPRLFESPAAAHLPPLAQRTSRAIGPVAFFGPRWALTHDLRTRSGLAPPRCWRRRIVASFLGGQALTNHPVGWLGVAALIAFGLSILACLGCAAQEQLDLLAEWVCAVRDRAGGRRGHRGNPPPTGLLARGLPHREQRYDPISVLGVPGSDVRSDHPGRCLGPIRLATDVTMASKPPPPPPPAKLGIPETRDGNVPAPPKRPS